MKQKIKKWTIRLTATGLLIVMLLFIIVLNPVLCYAGKTTYNSYTIYHDKTLDRAIFTPLDEATTLIRSSSFYSPTLTFDICLNDGSFYPTLIKKIRGQAFAWGFYDKVVLQGTADYHDNTVTLNGYKWNLTQLLAHELTHCLQFDRLGLFRSRPIANIPNWKWEGYAEYIARQAHDQRDILKNIDRLVAADKADPNGWGITLADNTISPREYYSYWILVQYCMGVKKMTYEQVLADDTKEEVIRKEMMDWYEASVGQQ